MNNNLISPQSNDPIGKLQNLLNNCLISITDVLSNLSSKGELKELKIVPGEESEYSYFMNLLKGDETKIIKENEYNINCNKITEDIKKEGTKDIGDVDIESSTFSKNEFNGDEVESYLHDKTDYFIKPNLEESLKVEILDRVEKMNLILKTIDDCIDELPNSSVIEEEKCKEMIILQNKKKEAQAELKQLCTEYDYIYNYVTDNLKDIIVNKEK
ncbi:large ribosomal subunit processing factor, putative [Hepatocystis sp. ex Piliocolobus tephrosceles]|nr:large ribosomal subunit processing factor, putative [Hepatocystis sp. ex Piliocolobus tephrosceles]